MNAEDLKAAYGKEYQQAMVVNGERISLSRETRFTRIFCRAEKEEHHISRFMDGSTAISAEELQREWPTWTEEQRVEFCQACCWLTGQSDFPQMVRFIMEHAGPDEWSGIAMSVASELPRDEAFDILLRALRSTDIGRSSNITQAIALTRHADAEPTLRAHLQTLWQNPGLWDDDEFLNWIAFEATTCISHLLELGVLAAEFEEQVRGLSEHCCSHNRESCSGFLSKYYSWLKR